MRCRLKEQAFIDGGLRDPGYEFVLPEGVRGPHRAMRKSFDRIDVLRDSNRLLGEMEDEPLYEEVK